MFVSVSREASECRLYAEQCADRARLQSDPKLRQDFWIWSSDGSASRAVMSFQSDLSFFRRLRPLPL
jgi:hypothetical protein